MSRFFTFDHLFTSYSDFVFTIKTVVKSDFRTMIGSTAFWWENISKLSRWKLQYQWKYRKIVRSLLSMKTWARGSHFSSICIVSQFDRHNGKVLRIELRIAARPTVFCSFGLVRGKWLASNDGMPAETGAYCESVDKLFYKLFHFGIHYFGNYRPMFYTLMRRGSECQYTKISSQHTTLVYYCKFCLFTILSFHNWVVIIDRPMMRLDFILWYC